MEWDEQAESKDDILNRNFDEWKLAASGDTFKDLIGNDDDVPADDTDDVQSGSVMQKISTSQDESDSNDEVLLEHLAETMGDGVPALATAITVKRTLRARDGKRPKATCERAAERDTQRLFERSNLSLPVKIEEVQHATADASMSDLTTFHVRPQSWVQLLLKECPELLGGSPGDCYSNFECVWKLYEMEHPTHAVFTTHAQHLHSVVPLCIHGDEGRGLKKANYLVMSMQSPLGSTPRPSNRKCDCEARLRDRKDLPFSDGQSPSLSRTVKAFMDSVWCNFRGHSYLSRFLLYGLAGVMCKSHPEVPKAMYALLADDLYELFHAGIEVPGRGRVYGAVIALKGDMDWHKKSLKLTRSWLNAGNESKGQICPHCLAGDINYPFEDYSENPQWTRSFFHSRPWTDGSGDWLLRIPFDAAVLPKPEFIIKGDLFHIMKTGCCRDVIGGAVACQPRATFVFEVIF
eukprot:s2483_g3.t1